MQIREYPNKGYWNINPPDPSNTQGIIPSQDNQIPQKSIEYSYDPEGVDFTTDHLDNQEEIEVDQDQVKIDNNWW